MPDEIFAIVMVSIFAAVVITAVSIYGWMRTTRMKIEAGYPLESMWGIPMRPETSSEDKERIKLLTQENAQLRAELHSVADRLVNVERIVTDSGYRLTHEIDRLRDEGKVQ